MSTRSLNKEIEKAAGFLDNFRTMIKFDCQAAFSKAKSVGLGVDGE